MSDKPLITVITVVFNGVSTIESTICSVLEQTYQNIEYIVVDGGSTDGTLDVIKRYDDRIDRWVSEKDRGIYDAMNKGIAMARGEYVGMLNADDFFAHPLVLEDMATAIAAHGMDAIFSCVAIVDKDNVSRILRKYRIPVFSRTTMRIGVMPPHPTFYCRKSIYEKIGPYRTDYRIAADFEMLLRLLVNRITWHFLDETTVVMRSGGLSNSGIRANWIVNKEIVRACRDNGLYTNIFLLLLKLPIRLLERLR